MSSKDNMYVASTALLSPFLLGLFSCNSWWASGVTVKTKDPSTQLEKPLTNSWAYWRQDGQTTLLRTDSEGKLFALKQGKDKNHPWEYTSQFDPKLKKDIGLFFSRGSAPLPDALIAANPSLFQNMKSARVMAVQDTSPTLSKPQDLSLWPLLWELPVDKSDSPPFNPASPDYLTAQLPQQTNLLNNNNGLAVTENAPAQRAPDSVQVGNDTIRVRPRERGLAIEGEVAAGATAVRVRIFDMAGNLKRLRTGIDPALQAVDEVSCTLGAPAGGKRKFAGAVFFENSADAFGLVRVCILPDGLNPPAADAYLVFLTGVQIALADDYAANTNGQHRGPLPSEADEVNIVDFVVSPQNTWARIRAEARLRRMVSYQIANEQRLFDPSQAQGQNNPLVLKPQMPMWMAELNLTGLSKNRIKSFMKYRYFGDKLRLGKDPSGPTTLALELNWTLGLYWDGPDANSPAFPAISRSQIAHSYSNNFVASQSVRLNFDQNGEFVDSTKTNLLTIGADGKVPQAFTSRGTLPQFPAQNRREPEVLVSQNRLWGRLATARQVDAAVVEHQPNLVDGGNEVIRGGNGYLECTLAIDGRRADPGLVPDAQNALVAPSLQQLPHARLPTFRVKGTNPDRNSVIQLAELAAGEYYDNHNNLARILMLARQCWITTVGEIFRHEGGLRQFDWRSSHVSRSTQGFRYGNERDMPLFGWPHGYGIGQIDNFVDNGVTRGANVDEVWNFVENIKTSVRILMEDKSTAAYNYLTGLQNLDPNVQRDRAVYQREVVRRYNGGREFIWQNNDWVISPSLPQLVNSGGNQIVNPRLNYPNNILGTNVAYSVGQGPNLAFPWPIAFTAADYGPGT